METDSKAQLRGEGGDRLANPPSVMEIFYACKAAGFKGDVTYPDGSGGADHEPCSNYEYMDKPSTAPASRRP